jgi:multidrug resistance efflux pump
MNAKKYAVRGLIAVAIVVAVCMFFADTIRTIATAKVNIISPKQGKLTQTVDLASQLNFPESDDVYIEGAGDAAIAVTSVKVQVGYEVEAGDVIFEAEVSNYDQTMASLRETYDATETSLQAVLDKDIRLKHTEEVWAEAYEALSEAKDAYLDANLAFMARAVIEGLPPATDGALPEGASEELQGMYDALAAAKEALDQAQADMDAAERYSISDDARSYITDKIKYERQLAETEQEMLDLTVLNERVKSVVAGEDGYITELNVKAGESFNPASAAYAICPKGEDISLRADTTEVELNISKGMTAYLTDKNGNQLELKVTAVGVTLTGGTYADVELGKSDIKDMGGVYALAAAEDVPVKLEYKAKQATTLLPSAAVRGSGTDRYVYTLQTQQSSFGTVKTVTVKTAVTVLAESDGTVSVAEDLSWMQVAYMEDRSIAEGDAVMAYSN